MQSFSLHYAKTRKMHFFAFFSVFLHFYPNKATNSPEAYYFGGIGE